MRFLLGFLLLTTSMFAQTLTQTTNCTATSPNSVSCTTDPVVVPAPVVVQPQPLPLPALTIQQPQMNTNLMVMVAMAKSNRPATAKQIKKWCKGRSGDTWTKRNWEGVIVDSGKCR